jgi:4-amino-4-deoxy-L-arabinose transferase-like glycosyltransferase
MEAVSAPGRGAGATLEAVSPRTVLIAILALAALRIVALLLTAIELGPDEAQYWRWSRELDWGYYSKPPLIAWAIALTTGVFGNAEWAIRLSAPLAHALGAWCLYLLGRRMFSNAAGVWAAAVYALMPGVWLSSTIVSTDAFLLPLWSGALYLLWRAREQPSLAGGFAFGAVLGLATLAKYAGLYLLAGAALAALIDPPTRRALLSTTGLAALAGLSLVLAPNLIWNANNNFATVSHTADNTDWEAARFNIGNFGTFLVDQMAVFGPLTFLLLLAGAIRLARPRGDEAGARMAWLVCFLAPPLIIIAMQAVVSRAHANWAASAYPAASVLVGALITRPGWSRWVKAGVALNAAVGAVYLVLVSLPPPVWDQAGATNAFKRVRGWDETAQRLGEAARRQGATAIVVDEREVWHGLDYYGRDAGLPPVRAWLHLDAPHNFAEQAGALAPGAAGPLLIASVHAGFRPRIRADFASVEPAGELVVPLGGDKVRRFRLYLASGYAPLPRTSEYFERFEGLREE